MVLLDGRGDDARDADAVTAHLERESVAVFVEESRFHLVGVLGAQLEDMSDLDSAAQFQAALAVRARVACYHITDVRYFIRPGQVAAPVHAREVKAFVVRAADEVGHRSN